MTITSHDRVTAALMRVGGIRGLIECVRNARMNASARAAYVQAFDALAEAVAEAESDGFHRGAAAMKEVAAGLATTMAEGEAEDRAQPDAKKAAIDLGNLIAITITNAPIPEDKP